MRSDASRILLQKNSDFVFRFGIPFFESHGSKNTFFVCWQQNHAALSFISQKKHFCFFVAKTRWIQLYSTKNMFWFVFCNIGLFSVLLHQKKVFFQYAGSHPDFHLILLKQRFCFLLAKLRCLRIVFLRTTLFSISVSKVNFGCSILLKIFSACWQLNKVTLSHKSVSAFLCLKYAEFSFIAGKTCFCLFAGKVGCFQRYCTGKCFLPVCSESL